MSEGPDPLPDVLTDLLADHDAGLPVDPSVLADPRAGTVLDALAATRAELAAAPPVPVPPEVVARWTAVLAGAARTGTPPTGPDPAGPPRPERADPSRTPESQIPHGRTLHSRSVANGPPDGSAQQAGSTGDHGPAADPAVHPAIPGPGAEPTPPVRAHRGSGPVPRRPGARPSLPNRLPAPTGPHRPGRGRSRAPRPAVVAGMLLAVLLVVAGVATVRWAPPSVTAAQLGGVARAAVGVEEAGPLTDPVRRAACLRSVAPPGLSPDAPLAGGRSVVFEGRPGFVLLLVTGRLATFHAVVVDPGCGAGGGTLLADTVIGP